VGGRGRELREPPVLFLQVRRVVISETIIQREFPCDLPRVLREQSDLMFANPDCVRRSNSYRIDRTEKETGVRESDCTAPQSTSCQSNGWQASLRGRERVCTAGARIDGRRVAVYPELAAEFIRVVVLRPCYAQVCCWLLVHQRMTVVCIAKPEILHTALVIAANRQILK